MKIIPALTGPMSGKLGGMVASRNRGGQYFRRKAVPVNPDSNRQVEARSNFATLISLWNNRLTDAQREGWSTWAANTPRIDSLGQTHILTGQNAFVGANSLRLQMSEALIEAPPTIYNRGETLAVSVIQFDDDPPTALLMQFAFSGLTTAAGDIHITFGRPQNPSVNFFKGPYRYATKIPFTAGTPVTGASIPIADWPFPLTPGQKVSIRATAVYDDGRYTDGYSILQIPDQP